LAASDEVAAHSRGSESESATVSLGRLIRAQSEVLRPVSGIEQSLLYLLASGAGRARVKELVLRHDLGHRPRRREQHRDRHIPSLRDRWQRQHSSGKSVGAKWAGRPFRL
jgi:hypothetical protein